MNKRMADYTGYIYILTCNKNGKKYVGSSFNPKRRIHTHFHELECHKHSVEMLQDDYDKYGKESFSVVVLPTFYKDYYERIYAERKCSAMLRTYDPRYGYNYKDRILLCYVGAERPKRKRNRQDLPHDNPQYMTFEIILRAKGMSCATIEREHGPGLYRKITSWKADAFQNSQCGIDKTSAIQIGRILGTPSEWYMDNGSSFQVVDMVQSAINARKTT